MVYTQNRGYCKFEVDDSFTLMGKVATTKVV